MLVFGQMNDAPGKRFRVGLTALTMAEYFRDVETKEVMFLVDNIFRYVQAGSETSGLLGPAPVGSRLSANPGRRPGRSWRNGSRRSQGAAITSVQAVYVPADDMTDPAVAQTFIASRFEHRAVAQSGRPGALSRRSIRWRPRRACSTRPRRPAALPARAAGHGNHRALP